MASRRKKSPANTAGSVALWVVVILFILALLAGSGWGIYKIVSSDKISSDKVTGCQVVNGEMKLAGQKVFFIDLTDKLSDLQYNSTITAIQNDIISTDTNWLISIYTLTDQTTENDRPIFNRCKPRDGTKASALTENPDKLRKSYENDFIKPLKEKLKGLKIEDSQQSPIFELLQAIATKSFEKYRVGVNKDIPRKLFMYSDMIHYTQDYSMYSAGNVDFKTFRSTNYGAKKVFEMRDVEVVLNYYLNRPELQKRYNQLFWEKVFSYAGAEVVKVHVIGK